MRPVLLGRLPLLRLMASADFETFEPGADGDYRWPDNARFIRERFDAGHPFRVALLHRDEGSLGRSPQTLLRSSLVLLSDERDRERDRDRGRELERERWPVLARELGLLLVELGARFEWGPDEAGAVLHVVRPGDRPGEGTRDATGTVREALAWAVS